MLICLLVAQKVWDDRYMSNAEFAFIYPFFVTEEINKLEQKFLELVYPELRPPVASHDGKSPLRGKRLTNIFKAHAQLGGADPANAEATAKLIV